MSVGGHFGVLAICTACVIARHEATLRDYGYLNMSVGRCSERLLRASQ